MQGPHAQDTTVVLVGRNAVSRQGVGALLRQQRGVAVAGEAACTQEALELVRQVRPDVVLCGTLPPVDPAALITGMAAEDHLRTPVLVLTVNPDPAAMLRALRAGAAGYLLMTEVDAETLVCALLAARQGVTVLGPRARALLDRGLAALPDTPTRLAPLTHRERQVLALLKRLTAREQEVLRLLALRLSDREIAPRLGVSVRTVEAHVAHILLKLGAATREEAIALALEEEDGLAALEPPAGA